jgi:hypothetical protein
MFVGLSLKLDLIRILIGFAPNLATPRKIHWWPYCFAWWLDNFLGNFSLGIDDDLLWSIIRDDITALIDELEKIVSKEITL